MAIERPRCANCVGHVAYECDKQFQALVPASLIRDAMNAAFGTKKFKVVNGILETTVYAPGSLENLEESAAEKKAFVHIHLKQLQDELDCLFTEEEMSTALYVAEHELRQEKPEAVEKFEADMLENTRKFLYDDDEQD